MQTSETLPEKAPLNQERLWLRKIYGDYFLDFVLIDFINSFKANCCKCLFRICENCILEWNIFIENYALIFLHKILL